MVRDPRLRHLRHRDLDGLDRGRLHRAQANLSAFGADPGREVHEFTAANATDIITIAATMTLEKTADTRVVLTNTGGALPAPLQAGTIYYLIVSDAGNREYQLSLTLSGPAIDLSDDGTGTHTIHFPYQVGYPK